MNDDQVKGNWKELKGKVQKNWGKITDDDLDKMEGIRKELVGKVQQSYGKSKEEAEEQVDKFLNS
ncbi:CsbD family protein [Aliiglaciecola sp. SL4]|uniref:CsbD family protein n=1 Tax=Aliiglaciecola sp. SL4 TaxID=3239806 RepID=UPI00355C1331